MTTADAISLLQAQDVGRLSLVAGGYPIALPVNYAVDDHSRKRRIVVRTAPRSTIGSYQGHASLEVDSFDPRDGLAWSVLVRGELGRLHGPVDEGRTRFQFRSRWTTAPWWLTAGGRLAVVPADFVMSRSMLRGVKQRAEGPSSPGAPAGAPPVLAARRTA